MDKSPLVSIVIPTYNHAHYLIDALNSVFKQTYQNFEIIIIDNYSTDDTESVVQSFGDPRVSYHKFRNNGLVAASRNKGINLSRGEWVAFLDSDDIWHPFKLSYELGGASESYDVIFSGMKDFKDEYPRLNVPAHPDFKRVTKFRFLAGNPIPNSSVICRVSVIKKFLLLERVDFIAVEDFDLWLRMAFSGVRIAKVNADLLLYRRTSSQISSSKIKMISKVFNLYGYHFNYIYASIFTFLYLINSFVRTLKSAK